MVRVFHGKSFTCRYPTFVTAITVANLLLFQWPLYSFATATTNAGSWPGILNLLTLTGLQAVVMVMSLTLVSLLSLRVTKAICIALLFGNALALYFINTYNVLLDRTMIGNVFNTDHQEAFGLFHPKIIAYLLLLGVLPGLILFKTAIVGSSRLKRLLMLVATGLLGCLLVYASSSTWLWFDKQAKHLGGLMLPWAYIANTVRYFEDRAYASRKQEPLPPLHFNAVTNSAGKTIVVLVIGESARAENFSLYGYRRNTNPELAKTDVIALPNARACATYTTASIRCMLSHMGSDTPVRVTQETLPNYLQRQGVEVIWRSNNWGEPPLKVRLYQRVDDIRKTCTGRDCDRLIYDEALLYRLKEMLTISTSRRIFVVLHQTGSHGPTYYRKYPAGFGRYQPVCKSVDLNECSQDSLINAYDNTIVYTDHVLAETIKMLQAVPESASTMIYMSDHGESLGEHGFYLHGAPNSLAPDEQRLVPFLIWMSPFFRETKAISAKDILTKPPFSEDNIFHSVLGAFDASSSIYKPQLDLFNHAKGTHTDATTTHAN